MVKVSESVSTQAALQRLGKLELQRACVTRGTRPWAPRPLPQGPSDTPSTSLIVTAITAREQANINRTARRLQAGVTKTLVLN
jgi:hypothetical protein